MMGEEERVHTAALAGVLAAAGFFVFHVVPEVPFHKPTEVLVGLVLWALGGSLLASMGVLLCDLLAERLKGHMSAAYVLLGVAVVFAVQLRLISSKQATLAAIERCTEERKDEGEETAVCWSSDVWREYFPQRTEEPWEQ